MVELEVLFNEDGEGKTGPKVRNCYMRDVGTQTAKQTRGRKPSLLAPVKGNKKTEEKDKFWLRAFRSAMRKHFHRKKKELASCDRSFWREYLSKDGEPGKNNRFSSYSRSYKNHLFSRHSFVKCFREWLATDGMQELRIKHNPELEPVTYQVLLEYAREVLFVYEVPQPDSTAE